MDPKHTHLLTALERTIDTLDSLPVGKHPVLEQLLTLMLQALLTFLTEYFLKDQRVPTPAP